MLLLLLLAVLFRYGCEMHTKCIVKGQQVEKKYIKIQKNNTKRKTVGRCWRRPMQRNQNKLSFEVTNSFRRSVCAYTYAGLRNNTHRDAHRKGTRTTRAWAYYARFTSLPVGGWIRWYFTNHPVSNIETHQDKKVSIQTGFYLKITFTSPISLFMWGT